MYISFGILTLIEPRMGSGF